MFSVCLSVVNAISCGDIINTSTTLTSDIGPCSGNGLFIVANNIVLDCNGHSIIGDRTYHTVGIYSDGYSGNEIRNCTVTNFTNGIELLYGNNNNINHNILSLNDGDGLYLTSSSNNTITDNTINSNENIGSGIILDGSSHYNEISYNDVNSSWNGILIHGNNDFNILSYNEIKGNQYGITLDEGTPGPRPDNNIFNENVVCSNTMYDIGVHVGTGNSGDDNTCDNPVGWDDENTNGCTYPCILALTVTIESPENCTYPETCTVGYYYKQKIPLNFTVNETISYAGYVLDKGVEVDVTDDTTSNGTHTFGYTKFNVPGDGLHNIIVFANDNSGNSGYSDMVHFFYCKGDANKDRIIDIVDIVSVALRFGRGCGDPMFNPDVDLNDDCLIDIVDIVIIALDFGKEC